VRTDDDACGAHRTVVVPFDDEKRAKAVGGALGVDKELQPRVVRKTVTTRERANGDGWEVVAAFEASELKALRSAVSGYYDLLTVSVRTVEAFGDEI
jgi:tRNA threonylcarbamoyladenosine modification (KEOPS) complex  Pcc1 subunit